jgi:hypothetical protein
LANDRFWVGRPGVLVQRYEDLMADPAGGVMELARHLGIALDETEAGRIALLYSPESNRARALALRRRLHEAGVNLESAANAQICDPTTLLHWNHMREGDSPSWRDLAAPRHSAILHRLCGPWLAARGYAVAPQERPEPASSPKALRDLARTEADLILARSTFLIRAVSERFPRLVRVTKRMLGLPTSAPAGAILWPGHSSTDAPAPEPSESNATVQFGASRHESAHSATSSHAS